MSLYLCRVSSPTGWKKEAGIPSKTLKTKTFVGQFLLFQANHLVCTLQGSMKLLNTSPEVCCHSAGIGVAGWMSPSITTLEDSSMGLCVIGDVFCTLGEGVQKHNVLLIDQPFVTFLSSFQTSNLVTPLLNSGIVKSSVGRHSVSVHVYIS